MTCLFMFSPDISITENIRIKISCISRFSYTSEKNFSSPLNYLYLNVLTIQNINYCALSTEQSYNKSNIAGYEWVWSTTIITVNMVEAQTQINQTIVNFLLFALHGGRTENHAEVFRIPTLVQFPFTVDRTRPI